MRIVWFFLNVHVRGRRGIMRCSQLHTFQLENFHYSIFPVKKAHYSVRKNLHCTHCGQRKTLILYSPKEGIIPLFQNKNSVILIPIFLFKARAFIIGTTTQNIVHFVFRTRKTSFSPTRFFGIKRKQQQQQQQYSFKIIIYMNTFVADEHLSTRFCTISCNLYIINTHRKLCSKGSLRKFLEI